MGYAIRARAAASSSIHQGAIMSDIKTFESRDFGLQGGATLPLAQLRYTTMGTLSPARDKCVLPPSGFPGPPRNPAVSGAGGAGASDPARHFVVLTNLLSNGVSSS